MRFCGDCGTAAPVPVANSHRHGAAVLRYECGHCGAIHYQNPAVVAGCIAAWDGRIALCRRAIEPCRGAWTVPGGYMLKGETVAEAAVRETFEETGALCRDLELLAVYTLLPYGELQLFFEGRLDSDQLAPGAECASVRLWAPDDIPWAQIAFPTVRDALLQYCKADREPGTVRAADVRPGPGGTWSINSVGRHITAQARAR